MIQLIACLKTAEVWHPAYPKYSCMYGGLSHVVRYLVVRRLTARPGMLTNCPHSFSVHRILAVLTVMCVNYSMRFNVFPGTKAPCSSAAWLHKVGTLSSPLCLACQVPETSAHLLDISMAYEALPAFLITSLASSAVCSWPVRLHFSDMRRTSTYTGAEGTAIVPTWH